MQMNKNFCCLFNENEKQLLYSAFFIQKVNLTFKKFEILFLNAILNMLNFLLIY